MKLPLDRAEPEPAVCVSVGGACEDEEGEHLGMKSRGPDQRLIGWEPEPVGGGSGPGAALLRLHGDCRAAPVQVQVDAPWVRRLRVGRGGAGWLP